MRTHAKVQKLLCHETIANLSRVLREHRAGCRCRRPTAVSTKPVSTKPVAGAVRPKNLSKSTLALDAVAAAMSQKNHVGAGLIKFVYKSHLRFAKELTMEKFYFRHGFRGLFFYVYIYIDKYMYIDMILLALIARDSGLELLLEGLIAQIHINSN